MVQEAKDWLGTLAALAEGDRRALDEITSVITGYLARFRAYEIRDSWDDVIQEVLVALIRSHRTGAIRDARAFVSYTGMVTRSKLADHGRRASRPGAADPVGDPELAEAGRDPSTTPPPPQTDELVDLEQALDRLPERQRAVVYHIYIEGRAYQEAADLLGMPLGTLKRMQSQGLKALREILL